MTKVEKDGQGRFIGDAKTGPPPARSGSSICPQCGSARWVRIERATYASRTHEVKVFADGALIAEEPEEWVVAESSTSRWQCHPIGHPLDELDELSTQLSQAFSDQTF